jgi:hypothetical protein
MTTHIRFTDVQHTTNTTTVMRACVYDAHPSHDGEFMFYLSFTLFSDMSDLTYDHVVATPFDTNFDNFKRTRVGTHVCPFHLKNALDMVLQNLSSGTIERIESDTLMSQDIVTTKWREKEKGHHALFLYAKTAQG